MQLDMSTACLDTCPATLLRYSYASISFGHTEQRMYDSVLSDQMYDASEIELVVMSQEQLHDATIVRSR